MTRSALLFGDVVLIPAPFTNYLASKPRPCVIISGSNFNFSQQDVILAPISSVIRPSDTNQIIIDSKNNCFSQSGLKKPSAVKCGAIFAYSQSQISRKLGNIDQNTLEQIRNLIIKLITED